MNIIPLSTASLTVTADEIVPLRSWVKMFTPNGSFAFFRAKSPQGGYGDAQSTIELEHAITEVGDYLCDFASSATKEVNEETTLNLALEKIWSNYKGTKWQLGYHAPTDSVTIDLHYDNVLEAMLTVLEQAPNYYLAFNFNTVPWTVSLASRGTTVTAEGRLDRNVKSASITYDDSELCTRVYVPYDVDVQNKGSQEVYGTYNADQASINQYGLIEKTLSASGYTQAQAALAAQTYLNKHKKPRIGVEISALDLSRITGESLDTFEIGKLFRLALPKYNITVEECITAISYGNLYENSVEVSVSLADPEDAVVSYIKQQQKSTKQNSKNGGRGGKSSGGLAKDSNDLLYDMYDANGIYHTYIQATDQKISLVIDDQTGEIKAAGIWLAIDRELKRSSVKISADIIDLDGYVTTDMLQAAFTSAQQISTQQLTVSGYFTMGGHNASWQDMPVVKSMTLSTGQDFMHTGGTIYGKLVGAITTGTIYYLGR